MSPKLTDEELEAGFRYILFVIGVLGVVFVFGFASGFLVRGCGA